MKRAVFAALAAALVLQPLQASAQIFNGTPFDVEYLKFVSGSGVGGAYGVQVGPYEGKFLGDQSWSVQNAGVADQVDRSTTTLPFALYCVDFEHSASNSNGLVNVSALGGDLSNTRLQDYGQYQRSAYLSSLFDSWQDHQAALESMHAGVDFSKSNVWGGLHAAIWNAATGPDGPPSGDAGLAFNYFMDLADNEAGGYDTSGWYILSEADVDLGSSYSGQEFLMRVSVPEPSTLLLMMTGIFLLIAVRRRRLVGFEA